MKVKVNKNYDRTVCNMRVIEFWSGPGSDDRYRLAYVEIRAKDRGLVARVIPTPTGYTAESANEGNEIIHECGSYAEILEETLNYARDDLMGLLEEYEDEDEDQEKAGAS